jgi:hypothetical protein
MPDAERESVMLPGVLDTSLPPSKLGEELKDIVHWRWL